MDTRKLLEEVLNKHSNGINFNQAALDDGTYETLYYYPLLKLAKKGDPLAAEIITIFELQYLYNDIESNMQWQDLSDDVYWDLAACNGSKYGGLRMFLLGKYKNMQNLINQYAQYASVAEEFAYCKKTAMQPTPPVSSPAQATPAPVSSAPYHLGLGKERLGEHTFEQIKQKIEQGTFDPLTKAWQQGWPEWKVVSDVPEIASLMASQPPPLPDDGPPPL